MRIGVLTTSYPRHAADPSGRFVATSVRALVARGHSVEVLAADDADGQPTSVVGERIRPVRYLPDRLQRTFYRGGVPDNIRSPLAWPGLAAFPLALLAEAWRLRHRWDALVTHFGVPCGLVGAHASGGRPHASLWHSADVALASRIPLALRRRLFLRPGTRHAVVSEHGRDRLGLPARVLPMAPHVHARDRREARALLRLSESERIGLFVGRLVPIKGLRWFFETLPIDLLQAVRWVIAGDGPERGLLERVIAQRRVDVTFLGAIDESSRDLWLSAADFFVLPSHPAGVRVEGAPVAVAEAQAAALPVLASDIGGVRTWFGESAGPHDELLPPLDRDAWSRALRRLHSLRTRRLVRPRSNEATLGAFGEALEELLSST